MAPPFRPTAPPNMQGKPINITGGGGLPPLPLGKPGKNPSTPFPGLGKSLSTPNYGPGGGPRNSPIPLLHPSTVAPPLKNPWAKAGPVALLTSGIKPSAPVKPPSAGHGSQATAGTLPDHAKTAATTPKSLNDPVPGGTDKPVTVAGGGKPNNQVGSGNNGYYTARNSVPLGKGQIVGFTTGKGYYARNATASPAPAARKAAAAAATRPALTPDQYASQQVQDALAPLYANQTSAANSQNATIQNFAKALIAQLQGDPAQVQGDYNSAIAQQSALAGSAADALRNANPNQQDQQLLDAIGAPQQQHDQIANQNANVFNGGAAVGQYVNGVLPMDSLRLQGLAATQLARQQPAVEGLRAQQALQGALIDQRAERGKIDAMAPGLRQQYSQAYAAQQQKQQYLDMVAQKFGWQQKKDVAANTLAQSRYQTSVDEFNARQRAVGGKIDAGVSKGMNDGFAHNAQGAVITANGKPLQFNANGTVSAKAPTAAQVAKLAQQFYNGKDSIATTQLPNPDANGNPVTRDVHTQTGKMNYGQAYRQLRAMNLPDKKARQYLDVYWHRGERGRAWVTNEEQAALSRAGLPAKATVISGKGVLTQAQYDALTKAGLKPPVVAGHQAGKTYYVIQPGN